jgi:hypothetical protein
MLGLRLANTSPHALITGLGASSHDVGSFEFDHGPEPGDTCSTSGYIIVPQYHPLQATYFLLLLSGVHIICVMKFFLRGLTQFMLPYRARTKHSGVRINF